MPAGRNLGKTYKSRGGRPPRLYEALELAWEGLQGRKLDLKDRVYIEATVTYERGRREQRAAALRARDGGDNASVSTN